MNTATCLDEYLQTLARSCWDLFSTLNESSACKQQAAEELKISAQVCPFGEAQIDRITHERALINGILVNAHKPSVILS